MTVVPDDPDTLLRRASLAAALTKKGYQTAHSTLATKATRGGGPPYRLFGRIPLYRWRDALEWAEGRLGPPQCSTSEKEYKPVSA
jgi:hypothetical protein